MPEEIKEIIMYLLRIFRWVLLARIILSFFRSAGQSHPVVSEIYKYLYVLTEPLLKPLRSAIPPVRSEMGYIDLSPLALLLILILVERVLMGL